MSKLYVQPLYHAALSDFVAYAKAEACNLEVATFAYENVYEMDWQQALQDHKRLLADFAGKVSFHGVFQDIMIHSSDLQIAQLSKTRILESLKFAKALGAKQAVFHGNLNPLVLNDYYRKNWLDRNVSFWRLALEQFDGTVLLENVWEPDPEIFRSLLDQVASPRLKFCFDIAHANVYSRFPFENWIAAMDADMTYLHLSDNDGAADQHLQVGAGKIRWLEFTDALGSKGLSPDAVLEQGTLDKTKASIAYMKAHAVYPFQGGSDIKLKQDSVDF